MKIRKILPLVILAAGALFFLTGCDQLLDAIFQNNQISVDVAVSSTRGYSDYYFGTNPQVTCALYGSSGLVSSGTSGWSYWDGYYLHFNFQFTKLKNDTYNLAATYAGSVGGGGPWNGTLYDGNYGSTQFVILPTTPSVSMPYSNPGDSTGKSMALKLFVP